MARSNAYPGWQILLLLLVLGGIVGGWVGNTIVKIWPNLYILGQIQSVGLPTFSLDLNVFSLQFGFMFHINFFTILGLALAYFLYRRF